MAVPDIFGQTSLFERRERLRADMDLDGFRLIGGARETGTITLHSTTTTADVDFVDIPILKNDMGPNDIIIIDVSANNTSNKDLRHRVDINDFENTNLTSTNQMTIPTIKMGLATTKIMQDKKDTARLVGQVIHTDSSPSFVGQVASLNTNKDNFFTTAFKLRIQTWYLAIASEDSKISYVARIIRLKG